MVGPTSLVQKIHISINTYNVYLYECLLKTILEDADPVTQNGSLDYPGGKKELEFTYNEWGALVSDQSRGITDISYDRFGNSLRISYSNGAYTENVYSASGEKLKTIHSTNVTRQSDPSSAFDDILNEFSLESTDGAASTGVTGTSTTEYRGNLIYRDGKLDMVLFPGGYATVSGSTITFHYYTQDYLGNNRAVINGSTGAIEQTGAYYPYGGIIADLGNPTGGQPYKFGAKELVTANGLNEYDFGARQYYSAIPGFTKPDKICEKYYWLSPYLYCANNPVNAFDPDGNIIIFVNGMHFGDGGSAKYWNGVDEIVSYHLKDYNIAYVDGSCGGVGNTLSLGIMNSNISAKNRSGYGYIFGTLATKTIYDNLSNNETIKVITHSMGAATAKGFLKALMEYAKKNNKDPRVLFELDLAPFEWWDQKGIPNISTFTVSHWLDGLAWPAFMKNAKNYRTHPIAKPQHPLSEHSINSFKGEIKDVLDAIINRINDGKIKVYIDGSRIN